MRKLSTFLGAAVLAAGAMAGEQITFTVATGTNTGATVYADPFTGPINEISVYSTVATGAVSIAALDPYSGSALVLATNAALGTYTVWTPRLAEVAVTGAVSHVVTNAASADKFTAQGEKIRAVFDGSRTGVTYRVRIKVD